MPRNAILLSGLCLVLLSKAAVAQTRQLQDSSFLDTVLNFGSKAVLIQMATTACNNVASVPESCTACVCNTMGLCLNLEQTQEMQRLDPTTNSSDAQSIPAVAAYVEACYKEYSSQSPGVGNVYDTFASCLPAQQGNSTVDDLDLECLTLWGAPDAAANGVRAHVMHVAMAVVSAFILVTLRF